MGIVMDRNGTDLTEAEVIEVARIHRRTIQKGLHNLDNHDSVITHLESDMTELLHFYFLSLFSGIGTKTDLYSPVATAEFSKYAGIVSTALSHHHLSGFEIAQLEFHHLYTTLKINL